MPVLLSVGRLERLKGIETAIHALAELREHGSHAELVVIGDDSGSGRLESGGHLTERSRLQALAADLDVGDATHFIGAVAHDQLPRYYSLADVCAVPSYSESFGLVAIEAEACGTPVVASRVGGLRQLVLTGSPGTRWPATTLTSTRTPLPASSRAPSAAARCQGGWVLATNYSWERTSDRLLDVYRDAVDAYERAAEAVFA